MYLIKCTKTISQQRQISFFLIFLMEQLEQWKAGVQNGVEKNDWTDLIVHRTSRLPLISFYVTRILICCSATLLQMESSFPSFPPHRTELLIAEIHREL